MGHRTTKANYKVKVHKTVSCRTDFFYYAFRNVLLVSVPLLIFSIFVFTIPHSSAEISSGTDNVQLVLSTSCTVNAVVTSEHTVSLNGGQLDNNVGNTKLSAYCNDNNGYSIYAVGSSNDIDGNTDLVNTINEGYNIRTGVYNDTIQTNPSSWAMKLTAGTGTGIDPVTGESVPTTPPTIMNGYDNYSAIPSNYTLVANRISGTSMTTDTSISGSYLNTTYQIYANSAQPSGTYNGKVKYVMVHPNNSSQTTIPDLKAAFAAAGKQPVYQDENGYYYAMQDMTSDICTSVARKGTSTATQLVDLRDNRLYWVAKLDDDKCWMTQNLDLEINGTNTLPLNSDNTDISTDSAISGIGIYFDGYTENDGSWTWTPNADTATTSNRIIIYPDDVSSPTVDDWGNNIYMPYSAEGGDTYYYTSNSSSSDTRYISLLQCISADHSKEECSHYHVGNYYNWTAAVASNNTNSSTIQYDNVANSICPKGWRLPIATNANQSIYEFGQLLFNSNIITDLTSTLYNVNGFINIRRPSLWFVRSGEIRPTGFNSAGSAAYYWSSTFRSANMNNYSLYFNHNSVNPAYNEYYGYADRNLGRSVRCVARSADE